MEMFNKNIRAWLQRDYDIFIAENIKQEKGLDKVGPYRPVIWSEITPLLVVNKNPVKPFCFGQCL